MDEKQADIWAVVFNEGKNYIGRVVKAWTRGADGVALVAKANEDMTKEDILVAERVTLCPVFDFFSPLRPIPGPPGPDGKQMMGFARDPIVTPFDFCVGEKTPVHVRVGGIVFFDEMEEVDRLTYTDFVKQATKSQMHQRASRSGLTLNDPTPSGVSNLKDILARR